MEAIVVKFFGVLFRMVGFLILAGTLVTVLSDIQKRAFESKHSGLVSLLSVNKQLVGNQR